MNIDPHISKALQNKLVQKEILRWYKLDENMSFLQLIDTFDEDKVHDTVHDAIRSIIVEEFEAEQSKGVYPIMICGVEGFYIVDAQEYDEEGPFDTLEQAKQCVLDNWGEFERQRRGPPQRSYGRKF
jgi:hypothetical protein